MAFPGFVDLQVNGYEGVDFTSPDLTGEQVIRTVKRLANLGTVAFCPTVVTASTATYEHVLPLLAKCMRMPECEGRMMGLHLEGPFISPRQGAAGVHPKEHIRKPEPGYFDRLMELSEGEIKILTLAPEEDGAPELIRHARELGITVSVGHTLAGEKDITAAEDAGATLCTHLGNGCPNNIDRHRNPLWAQLGSALSAMIITDGHHLPRSMISAFMQAKAPDRLIVTSDCAPVAGCKPGIYQAFGHSIRITETGRIENCEEPNLAGSSATMLACVNHLASIGYADEKLLRKLAIDNPLSAIGLNAGSIEIPKAPAVEWRGNHFELA